MGWTVIVLLNIEGEVPSLHLERSLVLSIENWMAPQPFIRASQFIRLYFVDIRLEPKIKG